MTDITNTNIVAAILDQKVAGFYAGKRYAYVSVIDGVEGVHGWGIGVAVEDRQGYTPIEAPGMPFKTEKAAKAFADGMNEHLRLSPRDVVEIVISTMRSERHYA